MNCLVSSQLCPSIQGEISCIPGDKSISHRSVILSALSTDEIMVHNFLFSEDCLNTISIFKQMGIQIELNKGDRAVRIHGNGLYGLSAPSAPLDVGNSGTAIRLISGILAAQSFSSVLTGDSSIQSRPMKRIIQPLTEMGACIEGQTYPNKPDIYPPLAISPAHHLKGIHYEMPVASAQVKSAILLNALWAEGKTTIVEPKLSRDHTERMLTAFGAKVVREGNVVSLSLSITGINPYRIFSPLLN